MSHPRHNLPLSAGEFIRFVGRERDIVDLGRLLDTSRMVTLTGTGGIGKTRLALHLAERVLRRFSDGVRFVDLSEASTLDQVLRTVSGVLHAVDGTRTTVEAVITALRTQNLLLFLDTCEHAAGPVAELCRAVLRDCPRVRVLATSRQPLHLPEENVWRVPPLSLPARPTPTDPYAAEPAPLPRRDAQRYESVRLFVTRAHAARAGFEMTRENSGYIAEICRMLDGMPLAIELAAARVRVLSVQQILHRLDDRFQLLTSDGSEDLPPRQRTLRAVLEWSHDLLSEPERLLLHRLSVFGTWHREMAEEVCSGDGVDPSDILPLHFSLLDKSLVVMDTEIEGTAHYRLTETVRAYAAEQLAAEDPREERWERYLDFCVSSLEATAEGCRGPMRWRERMRRLRLLDHHRENHARVVSWALSRGRVDEALRVCLALRSYWTVRGLAAEGSRILEQVLATDPDGQTPHLRARALALRAELRLDLDAVPHVSTLAGYALEAARACRDAEAAAAALTVLAALSLRTGALEEGVGHAERALERTGPSGDPVTGAAVLGVLAQLARRRGDPDRAVEYLEQVIARSRSLDDRWGMARSLHLLGSIAAEQQELDRARALFTEALAVFEELESAPATARCSRELGRLHMAEGSLLEAREALATCLRMGFASGRRLEVAHALEALGELALAEDEPERAAALVGVAAGLRTVLDRPSAENVRLRSMAEQRVGTAVAAEAWNAWRSLPLEQVRDRALAFPRAPRTAEPASLTPREREIAELAEQGLSNREIAERLTISPATAARHIANIFRKLSISSRSQLTGWASLRDSP
ncbi:ATP-binding protein [Nocardiopsis algeriensis]|uniref:Putative ATPase/DNA-binding CsgD family transcriptional regulator n=1 Tax=Nocardiopsis algeriensis TaxID=1478215 RepID=A0A841IKH1_9ACTN|nr:LuxR C-terminal-related transcriptional regulator [Nocardiopsis algeriensis]MBB6118640.1 putative ATPase/DNA-binding CsgD family transcriptional regulator [Nocardiopsis algeriensis]